MTWLDDLRFRFTGKISKKPSRESRGDRVHGRNRDAPTAGGRQTGSSRYHYADDGLLRPAGPALSAYLAKQAIYSAQSHPL